VVVVETMLDGEPGQPLNTTLDLSMVDVPGRT
jgi:hypothetical protein